MLKSSHDALFVDRVDVSSAFSYTVTATGIHEGDKLTRGTQAGADCDSDVGQRDWI